MRLTLRVGKPSFRPVIRNDIRLLENALLLCSAAVGL